MIGANWTEQAGDMAVRNNEIADIASGDSVLTLVGVSEADVVVSGDVNVPAGEAIGLVARYTGSGDANYYEGDLSASGGAEIWKNIAGTRTLLATATSPATSGTLRFEVVGDLLQLFLNDELLVSVTDSSITSAQGRPASPAFPTEVRRRRSITSTPALHPASVTPICFCQLRAVQLLSIGNRAPA